MPELDELFRLAIEDRLLDLHTSRPGRVTKVNADNTLEVQPMVRRPVPATDGGYKYEQLPVVPNALLCAFGTARSFVQATIQQGDYVWLLFPETDIAGFLDSGSDVEPHQVTKHTLSCPLAIPFCLPGAASASDFVALAAKVDQLMTSFQQWATTHTHVCAAPGSPSATALPALAPPTSTAAAGTQAK